MSKKVDVAGDVLATLFCAGAFALFLGPQNAAQAANEEDLLQSIQQLEQDILDAQSTEEVMVPPITLPRSELLDRLQEAERRIALLEEELRACKAQ